MNSEMLEIPAGENTRNRIVTCIVENGTFDLTGFVLHRADGKFKACAVCSRYFCRDGDMALYQGPRGYKFWVCLNLEDCGFAYPQQFGEVQELVDELAKERMSFLDSASPIG